MGSCATIISNMARFKISCVGVLLSGGVIACNTGVVTDDPVRRGIRDREISRYTWIKVA